MLFFYIVWMATYQAETINYLYRKETKNMGKRQ